MDSEKEKVEKNTNLEKVEENAGVKETEKSEKPDQMETGSLAIGYIQDVSPIKRSGNNENRREYFRAVLQEGNKTFQRVTCFNSKHHVLMKKAEESKKALKFSPVKRKPSELKRYHEEIEIPNWAVIDESEVEFGYSQCPQEAEPAPLVTIAECKTKKDKSSATVVVFINCDTRPSVLVQLPYLEEPLMKKDVMANDDSDSIKLSLWGKKIEEAKSNGSYKLENVVIRKTQSFQGKVTYYLTTNTTTKIALSEIQVEGSNTIIDELKSYKVKLPAVNVHQITKKYRCQNCKVFKKSISEKRDLFECETCGKMKMEKDLKQSLETRLDFNSEEGKRVTVALYGPQILEYFRHWKTKVPENLKDIAIEFLRDEKTYLYYDNRNICIGFE